MQASDVAKLVRGRATAQFRGDIIYARPLIFALLMWATLAAARISAGPLQPELVWIGLIGPAALLPLCIQTQRAEKRAAPRLFLLATARIAFLLIAIMSAHAVWVWLTSRHE